MLSISIHFYIYWATMYNAFLPVAQSQIKLDPLHCSKLLVYRYLGAFAPHSSSPFQDDSGHEGVRQSGCCTARHTAFPPGLIFPVCSALLIHFPGHRARQLEGSRHLSAPVPTRAGAEEGLVERPTAKLTQLCGLCCLDLLPLQQNKDLSEYPR